MTIWAPSVHLSGLIAGGEREARGKKKTPLSPQRSSLKLVIPPEGVSSYPTC